MLGELAGWIATELVTDRIDSHLDRKEAHEGKLGVPVVTVVAAVIGTLTAVGLLLLERKYNPSGGLPPWPGALAGVRLVLVLLIAYSLRASGNARRGGWLSVGFTLAVIVNLFLVLVDAIALVAAWLGHTFNALISMGGGETAPAGFVWGLTTLGAIGLLADLVIAIALPIRRRRLN